MGHASPGPPPAVPAVVDVLARWGSGTWEHEVDTWVHGVLTGLGRSAVAPAVTVRRRFWSVVRRYDTPDGPVWFKECNPGQAFEGPLLQVLAGLEPAAFARPLAVDAEQGRLLLADAGTVHDRSSGPVPDEELRDVLLAQAAVQRRLVGHLGRLGAAGLPSLLPEQVPAWFEDLAGVLASLPAGHPQHLPREDHQELVAGLGRVRGWSETLADAAVPASFQHNDLNPGNVGRQQGRVVCFDVGDSFWSHPFAVLQLPLALRTGTWPWGPDPTHPSVRRHVDAYLGTWTATTAPLHELRALVGPAMRLAQAHRCESWRRLLQHVPVDRLGTDPPLLRGYLWALVG